jgi:hypothetical protein
MKTAKWALTVSADLDRRVRRHLDSAGRKGELNAFIEECLRARLLQLSMKTAYSKPSANDVAVPSEAPENLKSDGSYGG